MYKKIKIVQYTYFVDEKCADVVGTDMKYADYLINKWAKMGGIGARWGLRGPDICHNYIYIFLSLHDITVSNILGHGTSIVLKLKYNLRGTKRSK